MLFSARLVNYMCFKLVSKLGKCVTRRPSVNMHSKVINKTIKRRLKGMPSYSEI